MPSAFRFAQALSLLVVLACDRGREQAPTHRVELPKTDTLPAMTLVVPVSMERPLALETSAANPRGGYAIGGVEQNGAFDVFAAQVRVERYEGQQLVCSGSRTRSTRAARR